MKDLKKFYEQLKEKYAGSLVKVKELEKIEPNAKKYLRELAKKGLIEKVKRNWYWILDEIKDPWDFFRER